VIMAAQFDPQRAKEALSWVESVTGESFNANYSAENMQERLKSGVILCNLINKLKPGTIPKIATSSMPFKQMENISSYIEASKSLGVTDAYNFMTVDLFEGKNLGQVVLNLMTLKRSQGAGFEKQTPLSGGQQTASASTVTESKDQTTDAKTQSELISRDPTKLTTENDVKRTGGAQMSGRHTNEAAMNCPVCTRPITAGAVNALGKAWHTNCFTCRKCSVKLSTTKYYENNDQPYCERCILMVKPQTAVKSTTKDKGFAFGAAKNDSN